MQFSVSSISEISERENFHFTSIQFEDYTLQNILTKLTMN